MEGVQEEEPRWWAMARKRVGMRWKLLTEIMKRVVITSLHRTDDSGNSFMTKIMSKVRSWRLGSIYLSSD